MSEIIPFPKSLIGKFIGKAKWELTAPFEYHSLKGDIIKVPVGFVTDGASIPKFAYSLIGSHWSGEYARACVPHDWCYFKQLYSRKKCDKLFLEAMLILKVPFWKRWIMYYAVRLVGWIRWNKYKQ